jgi:hypothetical protein
MSTCKINIGHNRDHVNLKPLTDEQVESTALYESATWPVTVIRTTHWNTQYGETTERVTVVGLIGEDEDTLRNFIEELSYHLDQECISTVWGHAVGPQVVHRP